MPAFDSERGLVFVVVITFLGNFLREKPGRMTFFPPMHWKMTSSLSLWCERFSNVLSPTCHRISLETWLHRDYVQNVRRCKQLCYRVALEKLQASLRKEKSSCMPAECNANKKAELLSRLIQLLVRCTGWPSSILWGVIKLVRIAAVWHGSQLWVMNASAQLFTIRGKLYVRQPMRKLSVVSSWDAGRALLFYALPRCEDGRRTPVCFDWWYGHRYSHTCIYIYL